MPKTWTADLEKRTQRYRESGVDVSSEDAAFASQVEQQVHWLDMGPICIGARAIGEAPEDIIPDLDHCLDLGASEALRQKMTKRKVAIEVNGKTHHVREAVGVGNVENGESRMVWYDSPEAADQALNYLLDAVPGHVASRICLLAYHGRDLEQIKLDLWAALCGVFEDYAQKPKEALAVEMGG